MSDAAKESKYEALFQEYLSLTKEVQSYEDLMDKLKGTNKPATIEGKALSPGYSSFAEVYNSLPSNLRQLRERLSKMRVELEEILI